MDGYGPADCCISAKHHCHTAIEKHDHHYILVRNEEAIQSQPTMNDQEKSEEWLLKSTEHTEMEDKRERDIGIRRGFNLFSVGGQLLGCGRV
jgi:hypothetical protein